MSCWILHLPFLVSSVFCSLSAISALVEGNNKRLTTMKHSDQTQIKLLRARIVMMQSRGVNRLTKQDLDDIRVMQQTIYRLERKGYNQDLLDHAVNNMMM